MRFNYNLLNNRIAQVCGSQQEFARRLGISFEELQEKLKCSEEFTTQEMSMSCQLLKLPSQQLSLYFFRI